MSDNSDVRQAVVDTARRMYGIGLVVGTAGNVSGRRADGSIVMTPSSVPYADIAVDNLAVMDLDGAPVSGSARPSTEKAMHLACYNSIFGGRRSGSLSSSLRLDVRLGPASPSRYA